MQGGAVDALPTPVAEAMAHREVTLAALWNEQRAFFAIMITVAFSHGVVYIADLALQYMLKVRPRVRAGPEPAAGR